MIEIFDDRMEITNLGAPLIEKERFDVDIKNSSMISRLLNGTCKTGLIKLAEDSIGDKNRKYIPFWR